MNEVPDDPRAATLRRIRNLVVGVGRTGRYNGMDMLADAVLRILDEDPAAAGLLKEQRG